MRNESDIYCDGDSKVFEMLLSESLMGVYRSWVPKGQGYCSLAVSRMGGTVFAAPASAASQFLWDKGMNKPRKEDENWVSQGRSRVVKEDTAKVELTWV